jgi:DNA polymerase-3 subunit gamma/tau
VFELAQEPETVSAPAPLPAVQATPEPEAISAVGSGVDDFVGQWPVLAAKMPLSGMAQQCVLQAACLGFSGDELRLLVPTDALAKGPHLDRVRQVLAQSFGAEVKLTVSVGEVGAGLSAQWFAQEAEKARLAAAVQTLDDDPFVQALIQSFGAQIVSGSIKSVTSTPNTSIK